MNGSGPVPGGGAADGLPRSELPVSTVPDGGEAAITVPGAPFFPDPACPICNGTIRLAEGDGATVPGSESAGADSTPCQAPTAPAPSTLPRGYIPKGYGPPNDMPLEHLADGGGDNGHYVNLPLGSELTIWDCWACPSCGAPWGRIGSIPSGGAAAECRNGDFWTFDDLRDRYIRGAYAPRTAASDAPLVTKNPALYPVPGASVPPARPLRLFLAVVFAIAGAAALVAGLFTRDSGAFLAGVLLTVGALAFVWSLPRSGT